jgi:large subunit ribosomal protein L20
MARVKRGTISNKSRRNVLKQAKGYRFARSKTEKLAKQAIWRAGNYAFAHRRRKKGDFRKLWTIRLNAAVRPLGFSYSRFIDALNKKNVGVNRKILSELAAQRPAIFETIVNHVK